MIAKFGLLLLIVAMGALLFLAGVTAPPEVAQPLANALHAPTAGLDAAPAPQGDEPQAAADDGGSGGGGADLPVVSYRSLMLPILPPPKAKYGVRLARFDQAEEAQPLIARLDDKRIDHQLLTVEDQLKQRWKILVTGSYADEAEARDRAEWLATELGLSRDPPQPILLPLLP